MVKWLRHRPFTAVTGVQIPLESYADVAQLAEQLICNQQVIGSSPIIGFFFLFIGRFSELPYNKKRIREDAGLWTFSSVG